MIETILAIEGIEAITVAVAGATASELIGLSKLRENSLTQLVGRLLVTVGMALQGTKKPPEGTQTASRGGRNFS